MKTIEDVVSEVRRLAKEFPKCMYTAPGCTKPEPGQLCSNVDGKCSNGTKGCIIGQAFRNLGIKIPDLHDKSGAPSLCGKVFGLEENVDIVMWLAKVQRSQDAGKTWAYAVRVANKLYPAI